MPLFYVLQQVSCHRGRINKITTGQQPAGPNDFNKLTLPVAKRNQDPIRIDAPRSGKRNHLIQNELLICAVRFD